MVAFNDRTVQLLWYEKHGLSCSLLNASFVSGLLQLTLLFGGG